MCRDAKYLVQDPFLNSGTPTYLAFFGFTVPFHVFSTMTPSLGKKHEKLARKLSEVVSPSLLMVGQCWLCTPCWCLEVSSSSLRWCSMLCQPHLQGDNPVELRWNIWALLNYSIHIQYQWKHKTLQNLLWLSYIHLPVSILTRSHPGVGVDSLLAPSGWKEFWT